MRPLEGFIAEQMECERFENYEKLLFTDYERDWNEKRLSEIFKREMNEWGPMSMGFQEYRQLANLWMRRHLKRVELEEDLRDHQSGHNSETAGARYGITSEDMNELTPEKLLAFFYASQEWHRLLGFKSNKRDNVKEKEKENPGKIKQKDQDEEGMMKWRKRMEAELLKERPYRVQSRISASQPLPASHSNSNVSVSGRLLRGLRQFQNDDKARFKSPEQGKALQLVIDGKKDVLAILPTGGGKSLLFFLPTMMEPGMTTVVIVPLIAVTDDLRNRCVKAKISCANWDPNDRSHERCDLIFVAVEQAVEPAFLNHLQIMHGMGILRRIVMDEAHVSLTHRDFRPNMEKLVIVMRTVPARLATSRAGRASGTSEPSMTSS